MKLRLRTFLWLMIPILRRQFRHNGISSVHCEHLLKLVSQRSDSLYRFRGRFRLNRERSSFEVIEIDVSPLLVNRRLHTECFLEMKMLLSRRVEPLGFVSHGHWTGLPGVLYHWGCLLNHFRDSHLLLRLIALSLSYRWERLCCLWARLDANTSSLYLNRALLVVFVDDQIDIGVRLKLSF